MPPIQADYHYLSPAERAFAQPSRESNVAYTALEPMAIAILVLTIR